MFNVLKHNVDNVAKTKPSTVIVKRSQLKQNKLFSNTTSNNITRTKRIGYCRNQNTS